MIDVRAEDGQVQVTLSGIECFLATNHFRWELAVPASAVVGVEVHQRVRFDRLYNRYSRRRDGSGVTCAPRRWPSVSMALAEGPVRSIRVGVPDAEAAAALIDRARAEADR